MAAPARLPGDGKSAGLLRFEPIGASSNPSPSNLSLVRRTGFVPYGTKALSDAGRRPAEAGEAETRSPTIDQSRAFQDQFDYLNSEVIEPAFGVRLRSVMLAFSRRAGDGGFFASRRWSEEQSGCRHEVGLHPATLRTRAPSETSATIVHQMVHAWQHDHGPPGRGGYHNGEWAAGTTKRSSESKSKSKSKASYACPGCALSIWGKPGLDLNCNKCQERLVVRL